MERCFPDGDYWGVRPGLWSVPCAGSIAEGRPKIDISAPISEVWGIHREGNPHGTNPKSAANSDYPRCLAGICALLLFADLVYAGIGTRKERTQDAEAPCH